MPLSELNAGAGRLMLWRAASGLKVTSCVLITQHCWPLEGNTVEWAHYCHLAGHRSLAGSKYALELGRPGVPLFDRLHIFYFLHSKTMCGILMSNPSDTFLYRSVFVFSWWGKKVSFFVKMCWVYMSAGYLSVFLLHLLQHCDSPLTKNVMWLYKSIGLN